MSKSLTFKINEDLDVSNDDRNEQIQQCVGFLFTCLMMNDGLDNWEGTEIEDTMMELDQLGITTIIND